MTDLAQPRLVRASAGSGKTYELSSLFISLLAKGEEPERILATTFTRKAAGEIIERVYQRLAAAVLSEKAAKELSAAIGVPSFSQERAGAVLKRLAKNQHRLNICTLDSLFLRMTSSFSLELELPPVWNISSAAEDERAVSAAVSGMCDEELVGILRLFHAGGVRRGIHRQLVSEMQELAGLYRETEDNPQAWNSLQPPKALSRGELATLTEEICKLQLPQTGKGKPNGHWQKAVSRDCDLISRGKWKALIGGGIAAAVLEKKETFQQHPIPDGFTAIYSKVIRQAAAVLLEDLRRQNIAAFELLRRFTGGYRSIRTAEGKLSFSDVKHTLSGRKAYDSLQALYYRLDCEFKHLLLDEFQDTSRAEWDVLKPFVDELLSKAGEEQCFFCVGDVKQAIYGWRGGAAEIFDTLQHGYRQLQPETREKSYRCAQPVLDSVNRVFGEIGSNAALSTAERPAQKWQERFHPHLAADGTKPGYVRLHAVPAAEGEDGAAAHYRHAAAYIKERSDEAPGRTVGVLVRKNAIAARIMFELSLLGVKASEEGGTPLTDSPAVSVICSLLHLVDHPGDTRSLFHVARSPLGRHIGLDSGSVLELTSSIRRELGSAGYGAVILGWAGLLRGESSERDFSRMKQLAQLGFRWTGGGRTADFLAEVECTKLDDPVSSPVRVMTIHQAKGLEFDIVVLPDLDSKLLQRSEKMILHRQNVVEAPLAISRDPGEAVRLLDEDLTAMHEETCAARIEEALSVLYVAMTRAKHALHMVIKQQKDPAKFPCTYAGILRFALANGAVQYEHGNCHWMNELEPVQAENFEQAAETQAAVASSKARRGRALIRRSPSKGEGNAQVIPSQLLNRKAAGAAKWGTLLHRLMQSIEWSDGELPSHQEIASLALEAGCDSGEAVKRFEMALASPEVRCALSRSRYTQETELFREQPFAYRDDSSVVSGIFDRLVICSDDGRTQAVEVIDYKTDRIENESAISEKVNYYRPQMEEYRRAAARFAGVDEALVSLKLVFLDAGRVCEVVQ